MDTAFEIQLLELLKDEAVQIQLSFFVETLEVCACFKISKNYT